MERSHGLTAAEVAFYGDSGYVGPFDLVARDEAVDVGRRMLSRRQTLLRRLRRKDPDDDRHVDLDPLFSLCVRREVLDRVEDLLGPNLVLWRTRIFVKPPRERAYPYHQDGAFWDLWNTATSPPSDGRLLGLSAWIALTDADRESGCVEVASGSHRELLPHGPGDWQYGMAVIGNDLEAHPAESMIMRAGQFFLFHNATAHRSGVNRSRTPRVGLAARFTVPEVALGAEKAPWWTKPGSVLVRGEDPRAPGHRHSALSV